MSLNKDGESIFPKFDKMPNTHPWQEAPAHAAPVAHGAPAQPQAPSPATLENSRRIAELEAAVKALRAEVAVLRGVQAGPGREMTARLERSENMVAELRREVAAQSEGCKASLEGVAAWEEIKKKELHLSDYLGRFSAIENECRKSLGEMQGFAKNIGEKLISERFDEYLRESVARLSGKLADVETAMYAGLGDVSSRLMVNEVLYKKMFTDAEERLKKSIEPELRVLGSQMKTVGEKVAWLSDEYEMVTRLKVRALEGKYSAFEAISKRMDIISDSLGRAGKPGGEGEDNP